MRARAQNSPLDTEFVVCGSSDDDTAEAEEVLRKLGFGTVYPFRGGFDA